MLFNMYLCIDCDPVVVCFMAAAALNLDKLLACVIWYDNTLARYLEMPFII